jgi:hypothetical protein
VELLSPGTEKEDLGQTLRDVNEPPTKWEVYERILRVPYYAVFSRESTELRIFELARTHFQEVTDHGGRFWVPEAGLGLGLWPGHYHGEERLWLRWYDALGTWIPTPEEQAEHAGQQTEQERQRAEEARKEMEVVLLRESHFRRQAELAEQVAAQERRRAEQERQRAEQERQRAERLAALLRQLGHDPDQAK